MKYVFVVIFSVLILGCAANQFNNESIGEYRTNQSNNEGTGEYRAIEKIVDTKENALNTKSIQSGNKNGIVYSRDGGVLKSTSMKNGLHHGLSKTYLKDYEGDLEYSEVNFIEGVQHGDYKEYIGKYLKRKVSFHCGETLSNTSYWLKSGNIKVDVEFLNGTGDTIVRFYEGGILRTETPHNFQAINDVSVPKFAQVDIFSKTDSNRKYHAPPNGWVKEYSNTGRLESERLYLYGTLHGESYSEDDSLNGVTSTNISTFYFGEKISQKSETNLSGAASIGLDDSEKTYNTREKTFPLSKSKKKKLVKKWLNSIEETRKDHKKYANAYNDYRDRNLCLQAIKND